MLLATLVDHYIRHHPYGVSGGHSRQLRMSVQAWEAFAGRSLELADLQADSLNTYLDWLRANRRPDTVRTRRGNLLILWHHAFDAELTDVAPRRLRKLRPIARMPSAWTLEEVRTLIDEAHRLPGTFWRTKIRRAPWWESLLRAAYDTGLRLGDLLRLSARDVGASMMIEQHKTGRPVHVSIRPATMALIDQSLADEPRDVIWPLWGGEETFYLHFRRLVAASAIRPGTFRWLRRSAATQLEREQPGRGTELLGHASRRTTEAWYLDRSQLGSPPLPPW